MDSSQGGTARNLGNFDGRGRKEKDDLTPDLVAELVNSNQRLIAPTGSKYDPTSNEFILPSGERVRINVGEASDNSVASFAQTAEGFIVTVSRRARDRDVVRAVAHEVAEIGALVNRTAEVDEASDRPGWLTTHLVGRFAEMRVLLSQIDRALHLSGEDGELPELEHDLARLVIGIGLIRTPGADVRLELLHQHDPALFQRLYLATSGFNQRPVFGPELRRDQLATQGRARLSTLKEHLRDEFRDDVIAAEALAMLGEMRLEEARRIFDPLFKDGALAAAIRAAHESERKVLLQQAFDKLDPINAAINAPSVAPETVSASITEFQEWAARALPAISASVFDTMREAAAALAAASAQTPGHVLDHRTGYVVVRDPVPGVARNTRMLLRQLFELVDRANRGAADNGVAVEYVVVVHNPVNQLSRVEILSRPRPQYRLDTVGQTRRPPTEARGGSIIDVGVGRSGYGAEMTPDADREHGGMVLQTELPDTISTAQRRRQSGVADPAPMSGPGSILVFGDLLSYGSVLAGPNGGLARMFINNLSGFHAPDTPESTYLQDYLAIARQICHVALAGARVEVQWDMKSERKTGGRPGDRGHLRGDLLERAIKGLGTRQIHVEREDFGEDGNRDYNYSIDAATSNNPAATKMAQYDNPRPQHRVVITFLDSESKSNL